MRLMLAVFTVALTALWATATGAQMSPEQKRQVEAFSAAVRALDPHTKKSEPAFLELVKQYVPATGPIRQFLGFMTASGFECSPETSLAENAQKLPTFSCRFDPDLGPTGEPSLSSVTEVAAFYVSADCDKDLYIIAIRGVMAHGFLGP